MQLPVNNFVSSQTKSAVCELRHSRYHCAVENKADNSVPAVDRIAGIHELGAISMDQPSSHQNEENILIQEIPDEELEACVGMEKANSITLWVCTAQYFCPGP